MLNGGGERGGGKEDVLLPSFTLRSSGGLLLLGSGVRRGGCEVKRAGSGSGFGVLEGFWRVVWLLLGVFGRGAVRDGRVGVGEKCDRGCRRSMAGGGEVPHGVDAAVQAVGDARAAYPCKGQRSILAGADIWVSGVMCCLPASGLLRATD